MELSGDVLLFLDCHKAATWLMLPTPSYQRTTASSRARSPVKTNRSPFSAPLEPEFLTSSLEENSSSDPSSASPAPSIEEPTGTPDLPFPPDVSITLKQGSDKSASSTASSTTSSHLPAKSNTRMEGIMESVPTFHGKKDGYEDPTEYLETINFVVEERYSDEAKALTVKRMTFRGRLRDEASGWYQRLEPATRGNWTILSNEFVAEYKLEPRSGPDPNQFFNQLYNLKQGRKPITQYVQEAEDLYRKCPDALKAYMGNQFVAGIAEDGKLDMVQLYLAQEREITFPLAKAAVVKAYSRIGRPSPFDAGAPQPPSVKPEVTQGEVNAELLAFFRGLRAGPQSQITLPSHPTTQLNPQQQTSGVGYPKQARDGQANVGRYPRGSLVDVICHNCMEPGHFSSSCPHPQVGFREKAANRAKVEEMQHEGRAPMPQQAKAAPAAAARPYQDEQAPKGRGPLVENANSGNARRTSTPLPMTPAILRRGQTLDAWQQSVKPALVAKPKQKVRFDLQDENRQPGEANATPATRIQKLPQRAEREEARRIATKAAERAIYGRPREQGIVEEISDDEEGQPFIPNIHATVEEIQDEQFARPQPVEADADEMDVQMTDPNDSWMRAPNEANPIDFRRDTSAETLNPSPKQSLSDLRTDYRRQKPYSGPKETVAINMAKGKERFEVSKFLDFSVTLPIWQLLDRSPQIRAQLARAMASSKPSRRGRRKVAAVSMMVSEHKAPEVETEAHPDAEVVCLYVVAWVADTKIEKTLVDNGAVVELINPQLVETLKLEIFEMDDEWTLQLADDGQAQVKRYVWVPVNVAGIVAVVRAFVLGRGGIYDLLLSKRWMKRVRAVEDHGNATLTIEGKDEVKRTVTGTEVEPWDVELVNGPSVAEWEDELAEDEIAKLVEELDNYDYKADQGKVRRQ